MGGSVRRRDLEKATVKFATAMLDEKPSKRWIERLRDEVRDEWRSLGSSDARKEAVDSLKDLTKLAQAAGGRAAEAAGEDMARNVLWSIDPDRESGSKLLRLLDRNDAPVAWNEEAQVGLTEGDVAALLALMDADARDRRFDVDRFADRHERDVERASKRMADAFEDADGEVAWFAANFSVYAEGLEGNWDDMSRRERRDALDLVQEGELPKRATMKEFLGSGDIAGPSRKALQIIEADEGLTRSEYARTNMRLVEAIAGEKLSKSERDLFREEGRHSWNTSTPEERLAGYEILSQRKNVADARGGAAIEAAGEDAVRNGLMDIWGQEEWSSKGIYRVLNKHDRVLAWNDGGEVAVTVADAEAIAAMYSARAKDKNFDADDFSRDTFRFLKKELREDFGEYSSDGAVRIAQLSAYAAGLEEAWDDLSRSERRKALEFPWEPDPVGPKLMRKIVGEDDLWALRDAALAVENLDTDLNQRGGGGSSSLDVTVALFEASNQMYNQSLVSTMMAGGNLSFFDPFGW